MLLVEVFHNVESLDIKVMFSPARISLVETRETLVCFLFLSG